MNFNIDETNRLVACITFLLYSIHVYTYTILLEENKNLRLTRYSLRGRYDSMQLELTVFFHREFRSSIKLFDKNARVTSDILIHQMLVYAKRIKFLPLPFLIQKGLLDESLV